MNELELKQEITPVETRANEITVTNGEEYSEASNFLLKIKEMQKKVGEYWKPLRENAHKAWKSICDKEKEFTSPLQEAEHIIKGKMIEWQRQEEEKRLAEQRRLQAEAEERARKERERLIKQAEKLKTPVLKEQRLQEAEEVEAPEITLQTEKPKVTGISTRKLWKAKLEDKEKFIRAALDDKNLMPYIEIDMGKLNKMAAATKGEIEYPGVKFYEEMTIAGRA